MGIDYLWKRTEEALRRYGIVLVTAILGNVAAILAILTYFGVTGWGPLGITLGAIVAGSTLTYICMATYRVYAENKRLKQSAGDFHQINHHYRDILFEMFSQVESHGSPTDSEILAKEQVVLSDISKKIANIFWLLTKSKCMVTVNLLEDDNGEKLCFLWARSEMDINRDQRPVIKFEVTPENTKYHEALVSRPGCPAHFYGADLETMEADEKYYDKTPNWKKLYRSCIAVPIRHFKTGSPSVNDVLGFLVVDTMDVYRLNDGIHVQFLAGFADQMYNFLSLMRGRYTRNLRETARTGDNTRVSSGQI